VVRPEEATTSSVVVMSPKNNPEVGDRWGTGERTPREYNADRLIYQPPPPCESRDYREADRWVNNRKEVCWVTR
jgi:hypothetical protein